MQTNQAILIKLFPIYHAVRKRNAGLTIPLIQMKYRLRRSPIASDPIVRVGPFFAFVKTLQFSLFSVYSERLEWGSSTLLRQCRQIFEKVDVTIRKPGFLYLPMRRREMKSHCTFGFDTNIACVCVFKPKTYLISWDFWISFSGRCVSCATKKGFFGICGQVIQGWGHFKDLAVAVL